MTDYTNLQTRCQRGESSLAGANNLLAECYGVLGKLIAENERLESEAVYSAAGFDAAREEIARLKAEIAGLKTGYQAYERVNAELKAENETLMAAAQALRDEWRKDQADAKRYQWLRDSSQYDWDVSYGKLELRIETPHVDSSDLDACIDAAMGNGGQS